MTPASPGAAEFLIHPRTGALTEAAGTVPSVRGPVKGSVQRSTDAHTTRVTVPPNSRAAPEAETRDVDPAEYRATANAPDGQGRAQVTPLTDLTGTVLRIGPVGSGTTKVERTRS
ncbi:alpha-L-rhamnosidase C-terminal domain-containing protein [Streptomyces sp. NPDC002701]|uniref:alpha-L-rhamnosidase C-terminal domain-containing protein n=1 Tax=Streptomyces sp. NPDC002701 TaxID=3364661 RepID=UPI00369CABBD